MDISVTGGTGFLGAHAVAELVRRGHRVRVLARDPERLAPALAPFGVDPGVVGLVEGDVVDETAVTRLVLGADAVLHAASVYSFDSRRRAEMRRTNERGTEVVLGAARASGAGRIVHVSTVGALYPSPSATIGAESPVAAPKETYLATKAAADRVARRHAAEGAPVVISYPSALIGPDDPYVGDQNARLRNVLRGLMPFWPSRGLPIGDVRDTAVLHADLLTGPDFGARARVFGPGHWVPTSRYLTVLRAVTGRALPALFLPPRAMVPVGRFADLVQRVWPWNIPAEYGAIYVCAVAVPVDGDPAVTGGVVARPLSETVCDTVAWLHRAGLLTDRQAGAAVVRPPADGPVLAGSAGRGEGQS
ncbi:NAD-dependent epimerase/dehydratase family protein [Amycolatopsis samaneae]|uniref:NAD-dependent epimerase/dehydratase family protein n=1 Tax=Amycolatopsis samaneae TaxID=664691 RepID=A0ABW5GTE4_9PSEU